MRRIEKFKQLLEVQESLGGCVDLISPTRELVKEGKMVKISARSGDHQDRYVFLVRAKSVILYLRCFFHIAIVIYIYSLTKLTLVNTVKSLTYDMLRSASIHHYKELFNWDLHYNVINDLLVLSRHYCYFKIRNYDISLHNIKTKWGDYGNGNNEGYWLCECVRSLSHFLLKFACLCLWCTLSSPAHP